MELNKDSNDYSGENQQQEKRRGGSRKKEDEDDGGYYLARPLIRKRLRSSPYICMKCDEFFRQVFNISDKI